MYLLEEKESDFFFVAGIRHAFPCTGERDSESVYERKGLEVQHGLASVTCHIYWSLSVIGCWRKNIFFFNYFLTLQASSNSLIFIHLEGVLQDQASTWKECVLFVRLRELGQNLARHLNPIVEYIQASVLFQCTISIRHNNVTDLRQLMGNLRT